jgi:hypothetical protein
MFKKVIQSISKSLGGKAPAKPAKPATKSKAKGGGVLDKIAKGEAADSGKPKTPEQLCEIKKGMSKSEVHAQLKLLYRRYNRAASSLDTKTRNEADRMLDAIVAMREKHFGEI